MDVCLTKYGHCNYISGKHACIFYDEVCVFWFIDDILKCGILLCHSSTLFLKHESTVVVEHNVNYFPVSFLEYQTL